MNVTVPGAEGPYQFGIPTNASFDSMGVFVFISDGWAFLIWTRASDHHPPTIFILRRLFKYLI